MDENNEMENPMICMKLDINVMDRIVAEINNTDDWERKYMDEIQFNMYKFDHSDAIDNKN